MRKGWPTYIPAGLPDPQPNSMQPNPQTISGEIFDRLNALSHSDLHNEMLLRTLARDIDRLRNADAVAAYQLAGALAAFRGNVDEMRRNHEAAIRLKHTPEPLMNYSCSLHRAGFLNEAASYMERAQNLRPHDKMLTGRLTYLTQIAGYFQRAADLLVHHKLKATDVAEDLTEEVESTRAIQAEWGLDDTHTSALVSIAVGLAHARNEYKIDVDLSISSDDEMRWIAMSLSASTDPRVAAELNRAFVATVVDSELPPNLTSAFVIRFATIDHDANHAKRVA